MTTEFYEILLMFQQNTSKEVFYDKHEEALFFKEDNVYKPLFGGKSRTLEASPTLLVPISQIGFKGIDMEEKKLDISMQEACNLRASTMQEACNDHATSVQIADKDRELIRKYAGKKPISIMPFAHLSLTEDMKKTCTQLEKLFVKTMKNVSDNRSVLKIKQLYDETLKHQKNNDLFKVCGVLEKMELKKVRQEFLVISKQKEEKRKRIKKIFKRISITSIVTIIVFLTVYFKLNKGPTLVKLNQSEIDSIISIYEEENQLKSLWRREQIVKHFETNEVEADNCLYVVDSINKKNY